MADESDVSNAFANVIQSVLYPSGIGQPSVTGLATKVYRGWPQAASLDADLAAGRVNVTIGPRDNVSRNSTRWMPRDIELPAVASTITVTASGATVTFAGTITAGNLVGIAVEQTGYAYLVQAGDTLASVAGYYAGLFGVTASGASVTVPTSYPVPAAALAPGFSSQITRQTNQGFTFTIWAFDYPSRDATASAIDAALSDMQFIDLADGSVAYIRFGQTLSSDKAENANLYRRDLIYHADYPAIVTTAAARALFVGSNITRIIGSTPDYNVDVVSGETYPAEVLDGDGQAVLDGSGNPVLQGFNL